MVKPVIAALQGICIDLSDRFHRTGDVNPYGMFPEEIAKQPAVADPSGIVIVALDLLLDDSALLLDLVVLEAGVLDEINQQTEVVPEAVAGGKELGRLGKGSAGVI